MAAAVPFPRPLYNAWRRTRRPQRRTLGMTTFATSSPLGAVRVDVRRAEEAPALSQAIPDLEADLRRAKWLADWLDTKFELGGVRFGLDGIVGLIPVVGDTLGALAGVYPIWVARRHRLGKAVQARMALNLLTEWAVGAVPFVGDAFDVAFKANVRNVRLLERAAAKVCGSK